MGKLLTRSLVETREKMYKTGIEVFLSFPWKDGKLQNSLYISLALWKVKQHKNDYRYTVTPLVVVHMNNEEVSDMYSVVVYSSRCVYLRNMLFPVNESLRRVISVWIVLWTGYQLMGRMIWPFNTRLGELPLIHMLSGYVSHITWGFIFL